jgi:4-amino-4-deoxy-L-arabinose transferase-like glycosyltransferase
VSPSANSRTETLRALWPWLPLWTAVALLAIFSHGPMPLYSTRTLAVAWEMWSHSHWLVPAINGEPYSEKAPLLFWLIHAGWFVFGVSDVWPRVLEVLVGGTQLVLVSVLARRLFPERPWIARGAPWMLLALSYAFLFGQQIMYDVLLAVWALAALLCLTPKIDRAEPRWLLFGLCIGAGLLTKGPVMLLHVLFPWLLGPLWNTWAREHRARWYGRGLLSVLLGGAVLLAWALPAGFAGGEAYRQRLFFTQTAGRVVKGLQHAEPLQSHAHPSWWYLIYLPVLMFPFSAWLCSGSACCRPLTTRPAVWVKNSRCRYASPPAKPAGSAQATSTTPPSSTDSTPRPYQRARCSRAQAFHSGPSSHGNSTCSNITGPLVSRPAPMQRPNSSQRGSARSIFGVRHSSAASAHTASSTSYMICWPNRNA